MNQVDLDAEEGLDSKEGHVEEISMDDFMETLIEALDTDANVFGAIIFRKWRCCDDGRSSHKTMNINVR